MRVGRRHSERAPREYERRKRMKRWTYWPLGMVTFSTIGYFTWLWAWAFGYDPNGPVTVASNWTLAVPLVVGGFWLIIGAMSEAEFTEYR